MQLILKKLRSNLKSLTEDILNTCIKISPLTNLTYWKICSIRNAIKWQLFIKRHLFILFGYKIWLIFYFRLMLFLVISWVAYRFIMLERLSKLKFLITRSLKFKMFVIWSMWSIGKLMLIMSFWKISRIKPKIQSKFLKKCNWVFKYLNIHLLITLSHWFSTSKEHNRIS